MKVLMAFSHMERIDSLEVAVEEKIANVLSKYGESSFSSCRVKLEKCNSQTHTRNVIFACEVVVLSPKYSTIHIRKEAEDMHDAINEVGVKLNNMLSKEHKLHIARRHDAVQPTSNSGDMT
jgi:ribosomal subunit interface protein